MSKSQLRCFILSTPNCVNIRLAHPRCLHLFSLPLSLFNCLPIVHTDLRVPLLSNAIKISGGVELECQPEQEMEEKAGERRISLTSCHISSDVRWPVTPHIEWIFIKLADRAGLGGTGGCVFRYTAEPLDKKKKKQLKTWSRNEFFVQDLVGFFFFCLFVFFVLFVFDKVEFYSYLKIWDKRCYFVWGSENGYI